MARCNHYEGRMTTGELEALARGIDAALNILGPASAGAKLIPAHAGIDYSHHERRIQRAGRIVDAMRERGELQPY